MFWIVNNLFDLQKWVIVKKKYICKVAKTCEIYRLIFYLTATLKNKKDFCSWLPMSVALKILQKLFV